MGKTILVIGSGGREHAIAKAFDRSAGVSKVYVLPGNSGMEVNTEKVECLDQDWTDFNALVDFVQAKDVDLTFVGPEDALDRGIVDHFRKEGLKIVGPTQAASRLETSKSYAKKVMAMKGIDTATFLRFNPAQYQEACNYCNSLQLPVVIKEDGLAAGKGVYICQSREEVNQALHKSLKTDGKEVIVEEFLKGPEFSHFSLINEDHVISLGLARDYKRAYDNDKGPNTGGMGAISPVGERDQEVEEVILSTIVKPLAQQMIDLGTPYTGILYTGVMETEAGIKVIEFNVRLGDPETQVLLQRLNQDFDQIVWASLNKENISVEKSDDQFLGVVLASEGYPGSYEKGQPISIPKDLQDQTYFAGVSQAPTGGKLLTNGGRVLMLTGQGQSLEKVRETLYTQLEGLDLPGLFYRKDIGLDKFLEEE